MLFAATAIPSPAVAQTPPELEGIGSAEDDAQAEERSTPSGVGCSEGRVRTARTAGRCCWPDQTFTEARGRCEGPPSCPRELVAHGDACVARARGPSLQHPAASPPGTSRELSAPRPADLGIPARFELPVRAEETNITGLYVTGLVTLAVAYTFNVVTSSIVIADSPCCGENGAWAGYIPLVGGFVWPAVDQTFWPSEWFGIPGAAVQIGGLVMTLVGLLVRRTVTQYEAGEARLRVEGSSLVWEL